MADRPSRRPIHRTTITENIAVTGTVSCESSNVR
jgi:hypothetical protein